MVELDRRIHTGRSPFGELLARFRTEMGLTQEGLANAMTGGRLSARSITNYERSTDTPQDWILPHRPTIRALAAALSLSPAQHRQLVDAWDRSKLGKETYTDQVSQGTFVPSGREHVLQQLRLKWKAALQGTPQMVLIAAEAGMGKTSIATHFCDWVAANHAQVMVSWGESSSQGLTVEPYIAIRAATNRLLVPPVAGFTIPGIYKSRPELTTDRVHQILTYLPKLTGALVSDRTISSMANLYPDIPADTFTAILENKPGTEAVSRWDEYSRLLYSLSQDWPILIVLEDLHWAGDLTASLLLHLLRALDRATQMPIMILGRLRPDEVDPHPDGSPSGLSKLVRQVDRSPCSTYITMDDTLSPTHGHAFIAGLLRIHPMSSATNQADLVNWLYEHTSGQPYLTIEMLRHLSECGALVAQPPTGLWSFDPIMIPSSIPSVISSFIKQRLERVSRRGRALLETSAAMGPWAIPEIIAGVLGLDEDDTAKCIESVLVETHHLLLPSEDVMVGQRHYHAYRFPHALVRDYIYTTIPLARRRSLHIKLAEALETLGDDFDMVTMGAVANHYSQAEDWYGAEMAAYHTAQIAVGRMDWDLSEFWFDLAEDLAVKARDPRQLWRSRAARLEMLRGQGQYEQALELGNRILQQVAHQEWPAVEALARHHLGEILLDLGELSESSELLTRARDIHMELGHMEMAVAAAAMLSHTIYRQGHYDVAREHATMAVDLSKTLPESWANAEAVLAAANCEIDLGFFQEALDRYQVAIDIARTLGKLNSEIVPTMNIGLCLTFMGRHRDAVCHLEALVKQIEARSSIRHVGFPLFYLGLAFEALGQFDEARAAYQRSTDVRQSHPQTPTQFDSIAGLLRLSVRDKDTEICRELLHRTEAFIADHTWRGMEYPLLVLIAIADAHRFLGNAERYGAMIREAHEELMRRASLLSDTEAVDSYLNRVGMNVEVQRRFQASL
ncbi:MAG: AAA family ATPase [Thermomicrobiales bacterium]|nr:AAA family ATPase [Thermomicrobiales bacterium]